MIPKAVVYNPESLETHNFKSILNKNYFKYNIHLISRILGTTISLKMYVSPH